MGLTNVARLLASTAPPSLRPAHRPPVPMPSDVVVLKHCRCMDCRNFSADGAGNYYCSELIGGTAVVWATGERFCDPPPDAWHYCARYRGPQVSKDVWVWRHPRKKRPAPGGGRPGDGPTASDRPGENRSGAGHCTPTGAGRSNADATAPRAAQVDAGSNISTESERDATFPAGTDTGGPVRRPKTCSM